MSSIHEGHNNGEIYKAPSTPLMDERISKKILAVEAAGKQWFNEDLPRQILAVEAAGKQWFNNLLGEDLSMQIVSRVKTEWGKIETEVVKIYCYAQNKMFPPSVSEADKLADNLPGTLNQIIIKALQYLNLNRVLTRFPEFKYAYEGVSGLTYKFLIWYSSKAIKFGVNNLVMKLQKPIESSTAKERDERLVEVEKNVFSETAKSLADINEAYSDKLNGLLEADQTYEVIQHLKSQGKLHPAIAELTLDEERLWAARDKYLKPNETFIEAIVRLEGEEPRDEGAIQIIMKLDGIKNKIWNAERNYLHGICLQIFEKIAFPGNSFYEQLPPPLRPAHDFLKDKILLAMEASLSCGVDYAVDPARLYDILIQVGNSKGEGAHLKTRVEELSSADGRLYDLSKEVSRVAFPALTEAGECLQTVTDAAHDIAYGAVGLVDYGLSLVEDNSYFSWFAKPAREAAHQLQEKVDSTLDVSNFYIAPYLDYVWEGVHKQILDYCTNAGLNKLLNQLTDLLKDCSKPKVPSTEKPGAKLQKEQEHKEKAIAALTKLISEKIENEVVRDELLEGVAPTIDRFSNKRLNRQLFYAGVWGGLEKELIGNNPDEL